MRLEAPSGLRGEIAKQIDEDLDYMDRHIDGVIQSRLKKKNVENLTSERREGIERQKQIITDKLAAIKNFNYRYRTDYISERNKLIEQIHQLVFYAEFQADQQKKQRIA